VDTGFAAKERFFTVFYCCVQNMPRQHREHPNPWHTVSFGADAPSVVQGLIEIPRGSKAKYELDKESGLLKLDRVLFSAVHYPANYGFIPQTYCDDGDPLDILVISQIDFVPMCLVEARVIGAMRMMDQGKHDDKIIAVANNDVSVRHYDDIQSLPEYLLLELERFFEDYKKLENKSVEIKEFVNRDKAQAIVQESIELYKTTFV
jgi:inorganic pyrophosphatase